MEVGPLKLFVLLVIIYLFLAVVFQYIRSQSSQENETNDTDTDREEEIQFPVVRDRGPNTNGKRSKRGQNSVVTCSFCGTENDPDFQYCRKCITELNP